MSEKTEWIEITGIKDTLTTKTVTRIIRTSDLIQLEKHELLRQIPGTIIDDNGIMEMEPSGEFVHKAVLFVAELLEETLKLTKVNRYIILTKEEYERIKAILTYKEPMSIPEPPEPEPTMYDEAVTMGQKD